MIIKLPIEKNSKIIYDNFKVLQKDDIIILDTIDNCKYRKMICMNNNGYKSIDIYYPLTFLINKNIIYNELFFIFSLLYEKNQFNFIYLFESLIKNRISNNYNFLNLDNINDIKLICEVLNCNNNEYRTLDELFNYLFLKLNYYYNLSLCVLYLQSYNIKLTIAKKIISIVNKINCHKILFYGINDTIKNHMEFITNSNIKIKNNSEYFINNNNKLLKVNITENNNTYFVVNNKKILKKKYKITKYPEKFNNCININNLIYYLIDEFKYYHIYDIIFKKNTKFLNLSSYFINFDFNDITIDKTLNIEDDEMKKHINEYFYCYEDYNFDTFKNKINNKKYDETIYNILIDSYTFPFNYNKNTFTEQFKKIIYYFYIYNKEIENMKGYHKYKIKYIHNTLLKLMEYMKNENYNITNYYKIYTDYIFLNIFIILLETNFLELNQKYINIIKTNYFKNMKGIVILHLLSWSQFNKKLNLYSFILNLKNQNNKLLFFENKVNMNILSTGFDNKIKKVIIDPLYLYNFLKKEKDFIKWTYILRNNITLFFDNYIKLNKGDIKKLGKILYILTKIDNQNIENNDYSDYIKILKKYDYLIIYNDRINLKIRNIIKNSKINLGFLAKHIVSENDSVMSLSNDSENYEDMSKKLKYMTNRYYKYKGKYLSLKMSDLSSNMNDI